MEIEKTLIEKAGNIFRKSPVLFAYLYGSQAIGQPHPFSDLDVAIYIQQPLGRDDSRHLEMKMGLNIDHYFSDGPESDVRIINYLPLAVAGQIITEGILIYSISEDTRVDYETSIRLLYFDFMPFINTYQREYLAQIETDSM